MQMSRTHAVVLRSVKYGDQGLVVDMLTRQYGRLSFMVRLSRSPRGKMRRQFFLPLSMVEVDFDYRMRQGLQRLNDIRLWHPLPDLQTNPYKLSISMFLAEFLCHATRLESDNQNLFDFVDISLEWLDGVEERFANFHLVFMIRMSRFIGFFPNTEHAEDGGYFDLLNACFTKTLPDHGHFLMPAEASKISLLMRLSYKTMHLCAMSRAERNRCTEVILDYYRLHVPDFPQLKSLDVLRQLFV